MSEAPPNKKLKQTVLQFPKQESVSDSSEAGDKAQEMKPVNDIEPEESSQASSGNVQERMDDSREKEVKAGPSKYDPKQIAQWTSHSFQFRFTNNTYSVICDTSMTVLEALNTSNIFKNIQKKNSNKEIVIQRSKGIVSRAAVTTDFPCCLIERDEILKITFINNDGDTSFKEKPTVDVSEPDTLVTFYIHTTGGENIRKLMKNNILRSNVDDVCVFASKTESFRTALRRDGRFSDKIFRMFCVLCEMDSESIHEMTNIVDDVHQKHFRVIVISSINLTDIQEDTSEIKTESDSVASTCALAENAVSGTQLPINTTQEKTERKKKKKIQPIPKKEIPNSEETLQILRAQFKDLLETLKQRENLKNKPDVQKFFRAEYDKSVQSFSEVFKIKQLMRLSDSVCQIRVEGSARGTGFLLFDRFILTNAHVLKCVEPREKFISTKNVEAAFDFDRLNSEVQLVPVKKELPAFCFLTDAKQNRLDFALLELDTVVDNTVRPELLKYFSPGLTFSGEVCIVGHPDGGIKRMDPCFIIRKEEAVEKHFSENNSLVHVITKRSIEENLKKYENQINYNSCFFYGSSGSPVFDGDCKLIGVHTGGYVYEEEGKGKGKTRSVVEYSYAMQPILDTIRAQAKIKGLHEIVNILEAYSNNSDVSEMITEEMSVEDCD